MLEPREKPLERPSFDEIYMRLAFELARRSTCRRLQVGAVITTLDHRRVLAVGYNGNASGLPNDCDSDAIGSCGDLHAELNAIINCDAPRELQKLVYVTDSPCVNCAKALINLGNVQRVYYSREYRIKDSLALLERVGISTHQLVLP